MSTTMTFVDLDSSAASHNTQFNPMGEEVVKKEESNLDCPVFMIFLIAGSACISGYASCQGVGWNSNPLCTVDPLGLLISSLVILGLGVIAWVGDFIFRKTMKDKIHSILLGLFCVDVGFFLGGVFILFVCSSNTPNANKTAAFVFFGIGCPSILLLCCVMCNTSR